MIQTKTGGTVTILPLGQDGILLRCGDGTRPQADAALALAAQIRQGDLPAVTEVASSLASVLVRFDPTRTNRSALTDRLRDLTRNPASAPTPGVTRVWTIPVSLGGDAGPQLTDAAHLAGRSVAQAVHDMTTADLAVLAIGFAPGQPYIGTLPAAWDLPRQTELTPQVPAGALVVALRQLVLFANPSPTGWAWIGTTAFAPFRTDRADPFALATGDRIRFSLTDADTITRLRHDATDGLGGATCRTLP